MHHSQTDQRGDFVNARERTVHADGWARAPVTDELPPARPSNLRHELQETQNFNSILIGSEDADALAAFYTKLFGEPTMADGGYTGWQIGSGFVTVGPHSEVTGSNPQPGRLLWNIECDDVRATFDASRRPVASSLPSRTRWRGWARTTTSPRSPIPTGTTSSS